MNKFTKELFSLQIFNKDNIIRVWRRFCPEPEKAFNKGFSLLELLVASVIIAIVVLVLVQLMSTNSKSSYNAKIASIAYPLAADTMEILKQENFDNLTLGSKNKTFKRLTPRVEFTQTVTIKQGFYNNNLPNADLKEIIVEVKWYNASGVEKNIKINSFYFKQYQG
ncbi:MAG: prepilin-type N-terminal cleavage/methylation domain-containing protein [bacterium]